MGQQHSSVVKGTCYQACLEPPQREHWFTHIVLWLPHMSHGRYTHAYTHHHRTKQTNKQAAKTRKATGIFGTSFQEWWHFERTAVLLVDIFSSGDPASLSPSFPFQVWEREGRVLPLQVGVCRGWPAHGASLSWPQWLADKWPMSQN